MAPHTFTLPLHCCVDTIRDPALPPALFRAFLAALGADATLTKRLWQRFGRLSTYDQLDAVTRAHRLPEAQGLAALKRVLTPGVLCMITEALAPATGQPRPPEVLSLERTILEQTTATGSWRAPA